MRLRWWRRAPAEPSPEARQARADAEAAKVRADRHARNAHQQAEELVRVADRFNRLLADTYRRKL